MPNDVNVFGPFEKLKFAGATVKDFSVASNWSDQTTFLNITVVEDPVDNDYFWWQDGEPSYDNGGAIGSPFQLTYGGFTYGGVLKSVDRTQNFDMNPGYRVVLVSPIEVLDAAQVILAGYIGPNSDILFGGSSQQNATFKVCNLLNVYGWAENGGQNFGRSLSTEIGMPWTGQYGIKAGIQYLTSIPDEGVTASNYGSYIYYKGHRYKIDLSGLPDPPSYYRLGGVVNMSLLEVLTRFFEDAGLRWIVKLTVDENGGPHVISFITQANYVQQPLGQITQYLQQQTNIADQSRGQELRSDITQAFLVGGSLNILQPVQNNGFALNIMPFWGFDFQGYPIVGSKPDGTSYADDDLEMYLNASSIADIAGELGYGLSYPCSVLEMRCALSNYDTWAAFIQLNKPALAKKLSLYGSWDLTNLAEPETIVDILNDNSSFVNSLGTMFEDNHWPAVAQRLYEFVRGQADLYYGKKFIVLLPFEIQAYADPFTAQVTLSNELTDAGYMPEGEQMLGLNYVNESMFMDQTGRFYPFLQYSFYSTFNAVGGQKTLIPNTAYLKGSSTVIQYSPNPTQAYVFSRCEQGDEGPLFQNGTIAGGSPIFYITNGLGMSVPAMVVTAPDAVWAQAEDITGSMVDLASMMNIPLSSLQSIVSLRSTSFNLQVHPPAYYPTGAAVALKSNQLLYGPWGKFTSNGKLHFEQDDGLVPWEYGDYNILNQAAIAKLNTIATGNQVLERAQFTEAGIPHHSIGDQLVDGGPLMTSIECDININQVTTRYAIETFVNRIGAFTLENADRLRRIGKIYQQLRRTIRQMVVSNLDRASIMQSNYGGFMQGTSYAVEQHTPHGVLGARLYANASGNYTPSAWTQTYQESLANLGRNSEVNFQSTACAGMEVLLRPYTTNKYSDYLPILPGTDEAIDTSNLIVGDSGTYNLNPLQDGCDISWLVSGDEYTTVKTSKGMTDYTNARSIALRGPIMVCGWGYDLQGHPMPNYNAWDSGTNIVDFTLPLTGCIDKFMPDYLKMSNQWPAAPLDIVYDKFRSVWSSPGMILEGVNSGTIPGMPNGQYMNLYINGEPSSEFIKFDPWLGSVATGVRMQIGWNPLNRSWTVVSSACSN